MRALPHHTDNPVRGEGFYSLSYLNGTSCEKLKEPKIALVREEFVDLIHDPIIAIVLNQLLYWSRRVKDFDLFLEEEKSFQSKHEISQQYGWFYKSAHELIQETMLGVGKASMRKYLRFLIENGWVSERKNPLYKWDRTTQYRVNLKQLNMDLQKLGWALPGFPTDTFLSYTKELSVEGKSTEKPQTSTTSGSDASKGENLTSENKKNKSSKLKLQSFEELENVLSNGSSLSSRSVKNHTCNTENTTKITNREHPQRTCEREEKDFFEDVLGIWKTCTLQDNPIHLTKERKQRLHSVFSLHFQNDIQQWQLFCERVSNSPFLMGQGSRKWRVSLDWILVEENLIKILEGNFDNPEDPEQKQTDTSYAEKTKKISTILSSIKDPMWREWCSHLDFESRDAVSLGELESIANARFLEVEGERLVWIGGLDLHVLSQIENLRLKILPLTQRTFPKVRNLRTRLCKDPSLIQKNPPNK